MEKNAMKTEKFLEATRSVQRNMKTIESQLKRKEVILSETYKNLEELKTSTESNIENLNLINSTNTSVKEHVIELRNTLQNVYNYVNEVQEDLKKQQQEFVQSSESSAQASDTCSELENFNKNKLNRLDEYKEELTKQYVEEAEKTELQLKQITEHVCLQNELSKKKLDNENVKRQFEKRNENRSEVIRDLENEIKTLNEKCTNLLIEEQKLEDFVETETRKVQGIVDNDQKDVKAVNDEINEIEMENLVLTKTFNDTLYYKQELLKQTKSLEENKENLIEKSIELENSIKIVNQNSDKLKKQINEELELKKGSIELTEQKLMEENEIQLKLNEEIKENESDLEIIEQQLTNKKNTNDELTKKIADISKLADQLCAENNSGKLTISKYKTELKLDEINLNNKIANLQQLKSEQSANLLKLKENYNLKQKLFQEEYETRQNQTKEVEESNNIKQEKLTQLENQLKQLNLNFQKEMNDKNQAVGLNELLNVQNSNMSKELTKLMQINAELYMEHDYSKPPQSEKRKGKNIFDFDSSDLSSIEEIYRRRVIKHKKFTKRVTQDKENKNKRKKY